MMTPKQYLAHFSIKPELIQYLSYLEGELKLADMEIEIYGISQSNRVLTKTLQGFQSSKNVQQLNLQIKDSGLVIFNFDFNLNSINDYSHFDGEIGAYSYYVISKQITYQRVHVNERVEYAPLKWRETPAMKEARENHSFFAK